MADSIPTADSIARKAPKFIKSGRTHTVTQVQEFLAEEYGAGMKRATQAAERRGESTIEFSEFWTHAYNTLVKALGERGITIVDG